MEVMELQRMLKLISLHLEAQQTLHFMLVNVAASMAGWIAAVSWTVEVA
jgi:hypothetical protein